MLYETNIPKALCTVSIIQYAINKGHPEFSLFVLTYLIQVPYTADIQNIIIKNIKNKMILNNLYRHISNEKSIFLYAQAIFLLVFCFVFILRLAL